MTGRSIAPGDVLRLTRAASPQFVEPITVRVIREVPDRHTYHGWTWIEAYELDARGDAVAKRELFVLREGLHRLAGTPRQAPPARGTNPALRQAAPARGTSPARVR
ncbi:hypothetical protein O7628_12490 [Micromonospora sp. WMMD956]|uniref:hypothetical protein n=1 Tax=Micromonospora sp. WMMD956 TaxID=3016108 RepID=UPI002417067F|nr:hypothetical protein [Micromonospora sp. WMMD956]MDG4816317.1 hypothetical protein [Micromonospora sp. WMMD956]